jgi:hypothetical protein
MNGLNQKTGTTEFRADFSNPQGLLKWQRNYPFANSTKRCDCNSSKGSFEVQENKLFTLLGRKQSEIKNY